MTELFRRKVIKYYEENKLINSDFAMNLLPWKNSGFSIDNSVKKVYGIDPLICPKCQSEMKIIAIILDSEETTKILKHLIKIHLLYLQLEFDKVEIGRAPPNFEPDSLN